MTFLIRQARPDEAVLLSNIAYKSKSYWGYTHTFMKQCRDELSVSREDLESESLVCNVYESERQILGFYILEYSINKNSELGALFVLPEFIGRGVGGQLLQHAIDLAATQCCSVLEIQSDPNAVAFYRSFGATRVGQSESHSIKGRFLPILQIHL